MAVPLSGYTYNDIEVYPLPDVNVTPIYDGTELVEIKGWKNLIFWKEWLFGEIRSITEGTQLQHVTWTVIIPLASTLLGLCLFVIFSRRNSPEEDPESTTAKILRYLEEHPGSRQHQIADGIRKSRGAVAYQLHRLIRERKLITTKEQKSIKYYPSQTDKHSLTTAVLTALEDPHQQEILNILYQHPRITRQQIAKILGKSPDTIYWHISNLDPRILIVQTETDGYLYSLSLEAKQLCRDMKYN